jgi:hypothetical protein
VLEKIVLKATDHGLTIGLSRIKREALKASVKTVEGSFQGEVDEEGEFERQLIVKQRSESRGREREEKADNLMVNRLHEPSNVCLPERGRDCGRRPKETVRQSDNGVSGERRREG